MLVLSRKLHESIQISDNVIITMLGIQGDRVRLGIEAPAEVPVHRSEVHDRIEMQRRRQASWQAIDRKHAAY